ncbi:hypothetical protein NXS19_010956 [Fusarium pseudograminearum]|nr:hypothetical protein NXS19_010956 [Fusarium pseudograminearum]
MADLNILDIAQLGARLSSSLDLQTETYHEARQNGIPNLLSLIYSTSSTLRKLHELSQQTPDAFTEVCKNDINGLANACRVLYEGILVLLVHRDEQHDENKEIGRLSNERVECLLSSLTNKTFSNYKTWQWLSLRQSLSTGTTNSQIRAHTTLSSWEYRSVSIKYYDAFSRGLGA